MTKRDHEDDQYNPGRPKRPAVAVSGAGKSKSKRLGPALELIHNRGSPTSSATMTNPSQVSPRLVRVLGATLLIMVVLISVAVHLEHIPVPKSETVGRPVAAPHLFDVVLVDGAAMDLEEINELATPMAMVMHARMPSVRPHTRIAVYGAGLPRVIGKGVGVAGFLPQEDVFFIDLRQVSLDRPAKIPRKIWWAFIMSHEAMHLFQRHRGETLIGARRPEDYKNDPLEREAFREGLSVANSFGGYQLAWTFDGAEPLEQIEPNIYAADKGNPIVPQVVVRISTAYTVRGSIKRMWTHLTLAG